MEYLLILQLTEKIFKSLDNVTRSLRFTAPFPLLAYPVYLVSYLFCLQILTRIWILISPGRGIDLTVAVLWMQWARSPGKTGSHFHPSSELFLPSEKKDIITSTACWTAMVALLVGLGFTIGPIPLLMLYGVPYAVSFISFSLINYHGFSFWISHEWSPNLTLL